VHATFIVGLLVLSSLVLWLSGARRPRSGRVWRRALCEFVGLWMLCLALNVALGVAIILTVRTATPVFISIYILNDVTIALVSGLQAFLLYWRRHRAAIEAA